MWRSHPPVSIIGHQSRCDSQPYCAQDNIIDDECIINNNRNLTNAKPMNNLIHLFDELELLRSENFQLRLRVYNAEHRVDRLSAAALRRDQKQFTDSYSTDTDSECKDTDSESTNTDSESTDTDSNYISGRAVSGTGQNKTAAKAKAKLAVSFIHDLLMLNLQWLSSIEATVSAKSASVSAEDKRRWQQLPNDIEEYALGGPNSEKTNKHDDDDDGSDDEFFDVSDTDFGTLCKARAVSADRSVARQNIQRSSPPQPQPPAYTELLARNWMFLGKAEQQRIMRQVAYADVQRDKSASPPPQRHKSSFPQRLSMKAMDLTTSPSSTKEVMVIRSDAKTSCTAKSPEATCTKSHIASSSPPPSELSDYSEFNFFISCDEGDDEDDHGFRKDFTEPIRTWSFEEEAADWNDCDEEPVLFSAVCAPVELSTSTQRHCRLHKPIKDVSDSPESEFATAEDEVNKLNIDDVITTETIATSLCTLNVDDGLNKSRRCFCGGIYVAIEGRNRWKPLSVADAQVQCDDGNVVVEHICSNDLGDEQLQLSQLRHELDAQRRENSRLNDMLLRYQQDTPPGDWEKVKSGPRISSLSDSDPSGSPELDQQAAGVVHDILAKPLPPLLPMHSISAADISGGDGDHQRCRLDGVEKQLQLQLTQPQERIMTHEHQELDSSDDHADAVAQPGTEDSLNNAIRHMDQTDLVNVALPQVVERLHRALVVMQHRSENGAAK